jgi:hypothetical protein
LTKSWKEQIKGRNYLFWLSVSVNGSIILFYFYYFICGSDGSITLGLSGQHILAVGSVLGRRLFTSFPKETERANVCAQIFPVFLFYSIWTPNPCDGAVHIQGKSFPFN